MTAAAAAALCPVSACSPFQLAGWLSDKGVGRVTATLWVTVVAGVFRVLHVGTCMRKLHV